ncbi:MAG: hypothetical protein RL341_1675, partial [Pseudomonadota bacterium]
CRDYEAEASFIRLYAISMNFLEQKWLKTRMDIA